MKAFKVIVAILIVTNVALWGGYGILRAVSGANTTSADDLGNASSTSNTLTENTPTDAPNSTPEPVPAAAPSADPEPAVTSEPINPVEQPTTQTSRTVYRTPTGERYHYSAACAGDNATEITLEEAQAIGLTPCGKCA